MRSVITLVIALAMLALQYWLGTRRKPLLGALLPGGVLLLLAGLSIALRDPSGLAAGIPCAAGLAAAWLIGRGKAKAAEKAQLEKMKANHACVGDVRYIGLFSSIELVKDKATKEPWVVYGKDPEGKMGRVCKLLRERKFMTYSHENMIFISPPLIITEAQMREELAKVEEVLSVLDKEI